VTDKFHADGSLKSYKVHWVCWGFTQRHGIDCDKTFNPVVKSAIFCTVLSLAVSRDWMVHQLDVKNVILHATLSEVIYYSHSIEFVDPAHLNYICRLKKSL
jgi:hypothetical protein